MREFHVFETHLKRQTDFGGRKVRTEVINSIGRKYMVVDFVDFSGA